MVGVILSIQGICISVLCVSVIILAKKGKKARKRKGLVSRAL